MNKFDWTINGEDFMAMHDLIWNELPRHWGSGAFTGNGLIGAMIYGGNENNLIIEPGRTDVYDTQKFSVIDTDKYRIPLGKYMLNLNGKIKSFKMRQDLWNAEVRGEIITDKGYVKFRSFTHTEEEVIIAEFETFGEERNIQLSYYADYPLAPLLSYVKDASFNFEELAPPSIYEHIGNKCIRVQPVKPGGEFALVLDDEWLEADKRIYYISISTSDRAGKAKQQAIASIEKSKKLGLEYLTKVHRNWWHDYYSKTFLSVPDKEVEAFYWIQLYKLASAARQDRPMMDLMGPWAYKTCWAGIWWNLNTQLAYWLVYTGNHLDLGEPLCHTLNENINNLISNAPEEIREDSAMIGRASGRDLVSINNIELCNLTWACHNYWLQYRYSMDNRLLKEGLYPLLRRSICYYLHILKEDEEGIYHLPEGVSPEYSKTAEDTNINLALLSWGCNTLIEICSILKIDDDLIDKWKMVIKRLTPYTIDISGLMIGKNVPLEESHRHFSHLLMIYPLYTMNIEQKENYNLIKKSIDHWASLDSQHAGYSFTAAGALYAAIGDGDRAYFYLTEFLKRVPMFNTMYLEHISWGGGGHTLETPLTFASTLHDMLLQSWGNKIRIFPGVPSEWKEISFNNLRTEGAFLVSAIRRNGKTIFLSLTSEAGEPCRIVTGMEKPKVYGRDCEIPVLTEEYGYIEFIIPKGETVTILNDN